MFWINGDEMWEDASDYIDRSIRRIKPDKPLCLEIDQTSLDDAREGFIKISIKNMSLLVDKTTPWNLVGLSSYNRISQNTTLQIRNVIFSKTIEPAFLYSNIVENSYINGRLSRKVKYNYAKKKGKWKNKSKMKPKWSNL